VKNPLDGRSLHISEPFSEDQPVSLKRLAAAVPATVWHAVWREGTRGPMRSRFARVRIRPAHRDEKRSEPRPEEDLLIEWLRGEPELTKYWLSATHSL
jgi:SRSO17 transposase